MSAPSCAFMFDGDDNEIVGGDYGYQFVNIGLSFSISAIVEELSKACKSVAYKNERTKYVMMYGMRFEKELLEDCSGMTHEDVVEVFTTLYELGKFEPPDTRKRKVINRSMYSKKKRK